MGSSVMIHLLFLIVSAHSIHIPFYCKIRKTNCQQRPESTCCQHLSTTTSTTTSDTTIDTLAHSDGVTEIPKLKEPVSILNSSEADIFEAVPSEIDEVYVKITGENIETNFLTTTVKPEKYAPRFCLKLKFNCKLRSAHACCKYPLPPRDETQGPTTEDTKVVKLPVRPTRIQIPPVSNTVGKIKKRKSPFRRPLRKQQTNKENLSNEDNIKEINDSNTENSRRKEVVKNDIHRPDINHVRKSSIKRRRPAYISNNKSTVCRIINCARNKNHKCCQKPTKRTTTESSLTAFTTELYETTQYAENYFGRVNNTKIDKDTYLTEKNYMLNTTTSPFTEHLPSEISLSKLILNGTNNYQDAGEDAIPVKVDASNVTNADETETPTTEQGDTIGNYDTTMKMEYQHTKEMKDQTLLTSNMQHVKTAVENQFKLDENLDFEYVSQYPNASQLMYSKIDKMNETNSVNENDKTLEEEKVDEKSTPTSVSTEQTIIEMAQSNIDQSDAFKLTDNHHLENIEHPTIQPVNSLVVAKNEAVDYNHPERVNDYLENTIYEDNEQVSIEEKRGIKQAISPQPVVTYNTKDQPLVPDNTIDQPVVPYNTDDQPVAPYNTIDQPVVPYNTDDPPVVSYNTADQPVVPYNTIDQPVVPYNPHDKESLLEPNQILPRVSVECFRYSCLSEPHHDCCNPHTTDKRHTRPLDTDDKQLVDKIIEDNHDRVTHTITRVMKTVRW